MFPSALCLLGDGGQRACFESLTFGEQHYSSIECTRKILHVFLSFIFFLGANTWLPLSPRFHFLNTSWRWQWCASPGCPSCCRNTLEAPGFLFSPISSTQAKQMRAKWKGGCFFWGDLAQCWLPNSSSLDKQFQEAESISPASQAPFPLAHTHCHTLRSLLWMTCLSQELEHRDPSVTWPVQGKFETVVSLGVACLVLFNCCLFNQEMNSEIDDSVGRQTSGNRG